MRNNLENKKKKKMINSILNLEGKVNISISLEQQEYKLQCIYPLDLECMTLNRKKGPLFQSFIASNKDITSPQNYNNTKFSFYTTHDILLLLFSIKYT